MEGSSKECLIVGLGNPGSAYEGTRHNVGFRAVRLIAEKHGLAFRHQSSFKGDIARGNIESRPAILLLPMTYMNSSGLAVRLCVDYFDVKFEQILIICDDIALPVGRIRLKAAGSPGGHNGLKSIEAHLGTLNYPRLRIGVGDRTQGDLDDHVLGKFTAEEQITVTEVIENVDSVVDIWISQGIQAAMNKANQFSSQKNIGEVGENDVQEKKTPL